MGGCWHDPVTGQDVTSRTDLWFALLARRKSFEKVLYVVILEQKPQLRATGPELVSISTRRLETTEDNFDALTP